jgi:ornithine cyclodeaminase/alanine dehydrogenase-like protein (mu-crystallin family)
MSNLRMINAAELRVHVRFEDLIEPVSQAFQQSSAGGAQNGLIVMLPAEPPDRGDVYVKTGVLRGHSVYIVKVSPWFALNAETGSPQGGFIAVFDSATGQTLAMLDDEHYLSDVRTAAAGALAARVFAPGHIDTATVLGSGVQAYWQVLALHAERPFRKLLIWARSTDAAANLRAKLTRRLPGLEIQVPDELEPAVRAADVLITTTASREPLVRGEWLHPGQHITAIGADDPSKCELHVSVLERSRVFVDALETSAANGDIHRAVSEGGYRPESLAGEIGDVLAGRAPGRTSPTDITVAKFVGIGAQDLVAAETALRLCGQALAA